MKRKKIKKRAAVIFLSALLCEAGIPGYAAPEEIQSQLTAMKSLAELDLEANAATINILLQQCIDLLPDGDPAKSTLQSIQTLIASGNASSAAVCVLLDSLAGEADAASGAGQTGGTDAAPEAGPADGTDVTSETGPLAGAGQEMHDPAIFPDSDAIFQVLSAFPDMDLPVFQVTDFMQTQIPPSVLLDVPGDWGNNAASGRSMISYSPVNDSGAINPKAGTLTISCFDAGSEDPESAFANYEKSISDMSVTSGMQSEDVSAANLPAQKLNFQMNVGANQFTCETICFIYEGTIYSIELMQGQLSAFNYFPVFGQVVQSAEVVKEGAVEVVDESEAGPAVGDAEIIDESEAEPVAGAEGNINESEEGSVAGDTEIIETEGNTTGENPAGAEESSGDGAADLTGTETEGNTTGENPVGAEDGSVSQGDLGGSISSFKYKLNGHTYQFPTPVSQIDPADIQLDRQLGLPYDMSSDADVDNGSWTEIINTEYFYFENSLYKEMVGVTNMTGHDTVLSEGILTALIDTNGTYLDVVLPGNVHVGGAEQDILRGFPQFANQTMDGTAAFIGNDYLYACNVRDDGCNGYVIIKNDDPFYSAVSIICENSLIKEISFECLGSERANGVFLE